MDIDAVDNTNWLLDYGVTDDFHLTGAAFPRTEPAAFNWPSTGFNIASPNGSMEVDCSIADVDTPKEIEPKKRSSGPAGSRACREKLRRDRLNERFLELGSILEPGRPPKTDKAAILTDAVRTVIQLRNEAQKLKESNHDLQERIRELKAEKNELRDEKQRLKADKEKLEQQVKAMGAKQGYMPQTPAIAAAFPSQGQATSYKMMPCISYPGIPMWRFMPPATVDTSQDHVLRPPVA